MMHNGYDKLYFTFYKEFILMYKEFSIKILNYIRSSFYSFSGHKYTMIYLRYIPY